MAEQRSQDLRRLFDRACQAGDNGRHQQALTLYSHIFDRVPDWAMSMMHWTTGMLPAAMVQTQKNCRRRNERITAGWHTG